MSFKKILKLIRGENRVGVGFRMVVAVLGFAVSVCLFCIDWKIGLCVFVLEYLNNLSQFGDQWFDKKD